MTKDETPLAEKGADGGPKGPRRRRPRVWFALVPFAALICALVGLFAWQRVESADVEAAPARAQALFGAAGYRFGFDAAAVSGAPARVNLTFSAPLLEGPEGGWSWSSTQLDIDRLVYRMETAGIAMTGPHRLETQAGGARIDGFLRGGVEVAANALERISLRGAELGLEFDGAEGPRTAALMELQFCAPTIAAERGCGDGAPTVDADAGFPLLVYLHAEDVALRDGGALSLRIVGVAYFDGPIRFDAPPPDLVKIEIEEAIFRLLQGEGDYVDVAASGRIEIRGGRIFAQLTVGSDDAQTALARLRAAGALSDASAAALGARIAESGRLVGVLQIDGDRWRMLDLGPEAIPLAAPD